MGFTDTALVDAHADGLLVGGDEFDVDSRREQVEVDLGWDR